MGSDNRLPPLVGIMRPFAKSVHVCRFALQGNVPQCALPPSRSPSSCRWNCQHVTWTPCHLQLRVKIESRLPPGSFLRTDRQVQMKNNEAHRPRRRHREPYLSSPVCATRGGRIVARSDAPMRRRVCPFLLAFAPSLMYLQPSMFW